MYSLLAQIARLFPAAQRAPEVSGVAQQLMERADACSGTQPFEAQELRDAAHAYLRVVR